MKKNRKLGRGVAIVGARMSKFGMFKDKDSKDLFADPCFFATIPNSLRQCAAFARDHPFRCLQGVERNMP